MTATQDTPTHKSDIMSMIWKKTRLSCSVRLSDGITYSYRSLNIRKKRLLMKCSRSSCKAAVVIDISDYMLSQDVNDKSKRTSTAVLIDIENLIKTNPCLSFVRKFEHTCQTKGCLNKNIEQAMKNTGTV